MFSPLTVAGPTIGGLTSGAFTTIAELGVGVPAGVELAQASNSSRASKIRLIEFILTSIDHVFGYRVLFLQRQGSSVVGRLFFGLARLRHDLDGLNRF